MPLSSSGESWLRPMRSNLHTKTEEQDSNAQLLLLNKGSQCGPRKPSLSSRQLTMQASWRSCWAWRELKVCGRRRTRDAQHWKCTDRRRRFGPQRRSWLTAYERGPLGETYAWGQMNLTWEGWMSVKVSAQPCLLGKRAKKKKKKFHNMSGNSHH